ncbi:hypothetical protein [Caulobacter sp. NIBR1757]|uniref:ATP-grasp domain-containing protein n=1 Tax=Caulobacter sp. NIBR1757 TaxID=3016000 RepID=UPI0022F084A3|nr:hypothetical protein [Caulobacter sp. NIBR1757]
MTCARLLHRPVDFDHKLVMAIGVTFSDFPSLLNISTAIRNGSVEFSLKAPEAAEVIRSAKVVWNRRFVQFERPDEAHADDLRAIYTLGAQFLRHSREALFPGAFWVNAPAGQQFANNKVNQLRVAALCGMRTPDTLISNNPSDIRAFIGSANRSTIAKPMAPLKWHGDGYVAAPFTARISLDMCQRDSSLFLAPMIYQHEILKAYELRVVVMGKSIFAYKIDSQAIPEASLDWRAAQQREDLVHLPYELDDRTRESIFAFMQQSGIVFGSMDFIIDRDGVPFFLEMNEQGQFLFLEERCDDAPLLDAFVKFLESGDESFVYRPEASRISFRQFLDSPSWVDGSAAHLSSHRTYELGISQAEK